MFTYHCTSCRLDMNISTDFKESYMKTVGCHAGNSRDCGLSKMSQKALAELIQAGRFLRPSSAEVPSHA